MNGYREYSVPSDVPNERYDAKRRAIREHAEILISQLTPEEQTEFEADLYRVDHSTNDLLCCERIKEVDSILDNWRKTYKTGTKENRLAIVSRISTLLDD